MSDTEIKQLTKDKVSEEKLDWDFFIKKAPKRPSGTIKVKLKYKGRSKPIFFDKEND